MADPDETNESSGNDKHFSLDKVDNFELTAYDTESVSVPKSSETNTSLRRHWRTFVATVSAALASFSLGAVIGYSSPAVPDINSHPQDNPFQLDTTAISIVTSIIALGGIIGELLGGYLSDRFGRRNTLLYSSFPSVLAWVLVACAPNVACMYVGRFINGVVCGVADIAVPVYVSEISDKSVRGFMCSCHELFINFGLLYIFVFGIFLHWNYLAIAGAVIPVIMLLMLLFAPESPRWLLSNSGKEEALAAITQLRGSGVEMEILAELEEIQENLTTSGSEMHWKELAQPVLYKPIGVIVGLLFFQQMAGYGVLPEYMVSIFQSAGSDWDPYVQTAVVGVAGVLANILSGLVVDRAGRRVMLLLSYAAMCVSVGGLASFFTVKYCLGSDDPVLASLVWLPVLCMIMYNFGVSLGVGPIPFYLSSELLPLRARSKAGGLSIASVWLFIFLTTFSFDRLSVALDEFGLYWMMCGFALLGFVYTALVVPETKGRSLEEIEKMYSVK